MSTASTGGTGDVRRVGAVLAVAVTLAAAVVLRLVDLGHVSGFNADEAWYGVQLQQLQAGLPVAPLAPSGRWSTDVFLVALLAPVQAAAGPHLWVLRMPSLLAGLATVPLAYVTVRPAWGRTAALATALVLACLPIDVAYSRFGWDPSLMAPFTLLAIGAAARGRGAVASVAVGAGLLVHPLAALVLPLVWALAAVADRPGRSRPRQVVSWSVTAGLGLGLLWLAKVLGGGHGAPGPPLHDRLTHVSELWHFVTGFFSILSGGAAYTYFVTGAPPSGPWARVEDVALVVTGAVLVTGAVAAVRRRARLDLALLLGTAASAALLYAMSGAGATQPTFARYTCSLLPAVVLSLVVAAGHAGRLPTGAARAPDGGDGVPPSRPGPGTALAAALAVAVALLAVAGFGYLQPLRRGGQLTHPAFWISRPSAPEQVWRVLGPRLGPGRTAVYGETYWTTYPLLYLSGGPAGRLDLHPLTPRELPSLRGPAHAFAVTITGSPMDRTVADLFRRSATSSPQRWVLHDVRRRPTFTVYRF